MLNTLGLARGARGIKKEQRMFGLDPLRLAVIRLARDRILPPDVAPFLHANGVARAFEHQHFFHAFTALCQRLIGRLLELDNAPATMTAIGRHQKTRLCPFNAITQGGRRKSAEHHRMHSPDARTGLHGNNRFGHHGHVDHHTVALFRTQGYQRIGKATDLGMQFPVAQIARIALLALKANRDLVAARLQMPVYAVVRHIQLAIGKPFIIGCLRSIQALGKRRVPMNVFAGQFTPEPFMVLLSPAIQSLQPLRRHLRLRGKSGRWSEETIFF
jgi:hypothetical protein